MEFWAVEVKGGEPYKVELHDKRALHLSQACIGQVEEDSSESICLFVNVKGKKLVLGTLNSEKLPQQTFDLVFDKTFELSHNWKNGSVSFYGYTADNDISYHEDNSDSSSFEVSESDEDIPVIAPNGGQASEVKQEDSKVNAVKNSAAGKQKATTVESKKDASSEDSDDSSDGDATSSEDDPKVSAGKDSAAGKRKGKMVEPKKDVSSEDDDDSSDDDDATSSEDDPKVSAEKDAAAGKQKAKIAEPKNDASSDDDADSSDDDAMSEDGSEDNEDNKSASDEDSDSDEDEVTPVQVKSSKKKRASVSASKKDLPEKKAKLITPEKIDGKKSSVHVATPYPSKQAGKALANKPNQLTPMTEGSHPCKSCKKIFKSEQGVESHFKAKHSGGK